MKAELIAVGTEILTGQIVNTNAQFLSEKFAELGIDVYFHTAVGDNEQRLLSVLEVASQRSDMVVLCGGLGPTDDDLTKQTLARFLGKKLVVDSEAMAKLDRFFASRPGRVRTPNNDRQAELVEGSTPLQNPTGLAVGGLIEQDGVTYIVLPGPPSELKAMFTQSLQLLLRESGETLYSRVLRFFGIGESQLVTVLADLIAEQTDPTLAPYAKTGEVTLRLSTKSVSEDVAQEKLDVLERTILERGQLATCLYGYGEENSLAQVVATSLVDKGKTIAVVDGVTQGLLHYQLASALQQKEIYQGGEILSGKSMSEEEVLKQAYSVRQQAETDLGLAVFGQFTGNEEAIQQLTLTVALVGETIEQFGEFALGGYSVANLQQIACLQVFDHVRNSL